MNGKTVRMEVTHRAQRVPIFSRFLLVSMALLVVGIPAGFVAELLLGFLTRNAATLYPAGVRAARVVRR